jgi:hypothetical protein
MGTGSRGSSSNDSVSYNIWNRKTKLLDTGANIVAANSEGAGTDAYVDTTGSGLIKGTDLIRDPTGTIWETKLERLLWQTKWGTLIPLTTTTGATGLCGGGTFVGTYAIAALDTTEGLTATHTSAASGGSQAGWNRALLYTTRNFNPSFKLRWKIDEAAANIRFYAGFTSSTAAIGNNDDPLNAISGFGIGILTTQSNYRILSNDGSGATASANTTIAKDTAYHTIELWADDNASKFWWSLDGSVPAGVTTDIPASTTSLSCQFLATAVNADAKIMNHHRFLITSDK